MVTHLAGAQAETAEKVALTIAGPDFLDGIQRFGERLGEARGAVVLQLLQVLDALAQLHRGVDHQRVEQQDQQRQLPMHPQQDRRGTEDGQHGDQQAAQGFADELVDGLQIGDQVRGHGTAAEAFVFAEGDALETLDQPHANAIDDILGQLREQPRLQHVEQ